MIASSGNRTRAARVAGEHFTTEPTLLAHRLLCTFTLLIFGAIINGKKKVDFKMATLSL